MPAGPRRGFHTVTPRIVVDDVDAQVRFLRATFDATGDVEPGRPVELRIGDSLVMISGTSERDQFPAFLYVYVDDADRTHERALAAGATTMEAPLDTPYGDRRAMVRDPFGNIFQVAHVLTGRPTVYDAAGGDDALRRLAHAWHERVLADEVVSHAFSHGFHPDHTDRLAAYWAEALGGPVTFTASYGDETSVVRIHSGNGEHEEMDRRAIACFDLALTDAGFDPADRVTGVLRDYFTWATTTTMARYHRSADDVPTGLAIPYWSWDGLVVEDTTDEVALGPI
jgi:hemoglobin